MLTFAPAPRRPARYAARYETGLDLSSIRDIATTELEHVVVQSLEDPKVQESLKTTMVQLASSPEVRRSLRPYLFEAAAFAAGAVAIGVVVGRLLTRRA